MKNKIIDIHILKNKVVIYFIDKKIEINPNTYTEFKLYLNRVLSDTDLKKLITFDSYTKDLNYALKLIGKYAYTKSKLKKKLIAKKIKTANIDMIMQYLEKHNLLDDLSFAYSYANSLILRHKGQKFINLKLKELGISEKDIEQVIKNIDVKEIKKALLTYLNKLDKQYSKKGVNNKESKIIANLLRNGYLINDINEVINKIKLAPNNVNNNLKSDYKKFARLYDDKKKIMNALKRKGYSYSKIKMIMEEDYDLY